MDDNNGSQQGPDSVAVKENGTVQRRVSFDHVGLTERRSRTQENPEEVDGDDQPPIHRDSDGSRSEVARLVTKERKWSVTVASIVVAIPAFVMGLTLGYPSNALLDLTGEATELPPDFFFTTTMISLFSALGPIGAVFGGPVGGWISDRWGRKCGLMFSSVPYVIGYLLISYAHYTSNVSAFYTLLLTGRFLTGVGMGWSSAISPVYTGEMCSAKLRGIYTNFFPICITLGILFNFVVGSISNFRYYHTSLVAIGIVALFEVLMIWLPETPRWLMSRGYVEDAERVLIWLRGKKMSIEEELGDIKKSMSQKKTNVWKLLLKRHIFKPFASLLIIFFVQQAGGINAVTPFAGLTFSRAGISNPRITSIYAVGISGLVGLFIALGLVDVVGRKIPLVGSHIGQFISLVLLGLHAYITRPSLCDLDSSGLGDSDASEDFCNSQYRYMTLVSIILFAVTFAAGSNSIPYVLIAELLPLSVRGKASGIASAVTLGTASVFLGVYFELRELITPWLTLWAVALINLFAIIFIILFIPETKGKKLEELEKLYVKRVDTVETVL